MKSRIREVRRARRLTLQQVAQRCEPPTTPQTIGRLETGARSLSVAWVNRIARALGVAAADLVAISSGDEVVLAAVLDSDGARAPAGDARLIAHRPGETAIGLVVIAGIGDYRAGDEVWLDRLEAHDFATALNRDVLVPRPNGRFLFGRLIGREDNRLQILPFGAGRRQQVVSDPPWIGVAARLSRAL